MLQKWIKWNDNRKKKRQITIRGKESVTIKMKLSRTGNISWSVIL